MAPRRAESPQERRSLGGHPGQGVARLPPVQRRVAIVPSIRGVRRALGSDTIRPRRSRGVSTPGSAPPWGTGGL